MQVKLIEILKLYLFSL